ncbi:MAG TPA: asparagine synthase (glutamine-hydrolyzing) [Anaerolineales bacterium]|nr:asparagine synthase (glutamine-hydrolyzing) [Anaerolineales bacterium]
MCGITGKIYWNPEKCVESDLLTKMCRTLTYRGPDEEGYYTKNNVGLGVRRLSIIDVQGGHQPISNENQSIWAVQNGEIYNFRELTRELIKLGHTFTTRSDTEVIVHLYEEYGIDFVKHLEGMFAIALWDEREKKLVLARDRMGIKPLFYASLNDQLLFGSEIKAIRAAGPSLTLNTDALNYYLSLLYIPAPHTIYNEIHKLQPGHILVFQNGKLVLQRYWSLAEVNRFEDYSADELQKQLRQLLLASVERHLVSDVPLGFFLSGGLDSSIVVACAHEVHNSRIKTFSVGFEDPSYDETSFAQTVATHLNTDHTNILVKPDFKDVIHELADHFEEPFADSSAIPTYYLCELTRKHVTVALSGDGGDELFAGYLTYQADKLARIYSRVPGILSKRAIPWLVHQLPVSDTKVNFGFKAQRFVDQALLEPGQRHFAWKAFFNENLKESLLQQPLLNSISGDLDGYSPYKYYFDEAHHFEEITRFQYMDTMVYLIDNNLTKVDRISMAHSLEVRVPLLGTDIVEFAFKLPDRLKMPGMKLKHFLKESTKDMLPEEILNRPKKGFNVPMPRWLKEGLKPVVDHYLSTEMISRQGYFNASTVQRLVNAHMSGKADYSRNLWALLMFNVWVEKASFER